MFLLLFFLEQSFNYTFLLWLLFSVWVFVVHLCGLGLGSTQNKADCLSYPPGTEGKEELHVSFAGALRAVWRCVCACVCVCVCALLKYLMQVRCHFLSPVWPNPLTLPLKHTCTRETHFSLSLCVTLILLKTHSNSLFIT